MSEPQKIIRGWIIVAIVYSSFETFFAFTSLLLLLNPKSMPLYLFFVPVSLLCWTGTLLACFGNYRSARVFMWIAGIIALPLGLVLIRAGSRIKTTADSTK